MENVRSYLLSQKNFDMLEHIIQEKIYKISGTIINKEDTFFQQSVNLVTTSVVRDEITSLKSYDTGAIISINNIIIKECVNHILNSIEPQSSKLESLDDEESEYEEPETVKDQVLIEPVPVQSPSTNVEIFIFDQETTNAKIKNVISAELISCFFDFSDYIITEKNNCYCIDNVEKQIPVGNYQPLELLELISSYVIFTLNKNTDVISINHPVKKGLSGSIKQQNVNIDFGVKNSLGPILGFSEKTYVLKDTSLIAEKKHCIKHKPTAEVNISYDNSIETHTIPLNVEYNSTIHYTPQFSKKTIIGGDIENVNIHLDFNPRGRRYCFTVKFITN